MYGCTFIYLNREIIDELPNTCQNLDKYCSPQVGMNPMEVFITMLYYDLNLYSDWAVPTARP